MSEQFKPRPAQEQILTYTDGPMGVSAVPGSGKTFTLSLLAARLVERLATQGPLDDREVLIVTFTNSAVENFRARIGEFVRTEQKLLPGVGYRVRTLHGLAHDIVRERPALVGLSESFDIIDDATATGIKTDSVNSYLRNFPEALAPYILPDFLQNFRRIERYVLDDARDIVNLIIRVAKELPASPQELQAKLARQSGTWPLLEMGLAVYADYQRSLHVRGAVDFDDLIILALQALNADDGFLMRLQERWPYVLEDEAQDSSLVQEKMLRLLTNNNGNWVRVGDPNQAINTTFTSADTRYLQDFVRRYPDQARPLPNSGRSAQPIIDLANQLIVWSRTEHPILPLHLALTEPLIEPFPPGDTKPNPPADESAVHLFDRPLTPEEEVEVVVTSLGRWLPDHADRTVAVLVPDNNRAMRFVDALGKADLPFDDSMLRTGKATRTTAAALATIIAYVSRPQQTKQLQTLWSNVWWPRRGVPFMHQTLFGNVNGETDGGDEHAGRAGAGKLPEPVVTFGNALGKLREAETFLFPQTVDWLDSIGWLDDHPGFRATVEHFRQDLKRWTEATILPVDELLLTLGNDLFSEPADLALTHHLAVLLAKVADENPGWRLAELAGELEGVANNKRRIADFTDEEVGYVAKKGTVTVATMHAAKGLEWDRVYLVAVNDFSFPGGGEGDTYRGERWYVRESLNLVAEAEEQLRQLHMGTLDEYVPGKATRAARQEIAAERLRLLYVGMTRAQRELILTYNTGRKKQDPSAPALAFQALSTMLQKAQDEA